MEVFFQWKDWIRAFILTGLFGGYIPPLTPFLSQNFLEAGVGAGEVDRNLHPTPGGDPRPGSGDTWSWASSVWGIMMGLLLYLGSWE